MIDSSSKTYIVFSLIALLSLIVTVFLYFNAPGIMAVTFIPLSVLLGGSIAAMFNYRTTNMKSRIIDKTKEEAGTGYQIMGIAIPDKPKFKVGQILKVTNPSKCKTYSDLPNASKIRIVVAHKNFYKYHILDRNNKIIGYCECFGNDNLIHYEDK